jgi:hypothetical protein
MTLALEFVLATVLIDMCGINSLNACLISKSANSKVLSNEIYMGQKWYQSKAYDLGLKLGVYFDSLRGLGPQNLKRCFQRLNDFSCGVIRKCGICYKITL